MPTSSDLPNFKPWVNQAATPALSIANLVTQVLLAYSVYKGWLWLMIPLVILASHLMHCLLIAFHEASHGMLRKNRTLNEINGVVLGILSHSGFTLYRALHQKHHFNLATEQDLELWPFVNPKSPLWARRLAAFLELNFGLVFTPFLFWRNFFGRNSPIQNRKVRKRIWFELALAAAFWGASFFAVVVFELWPWFIWNYLIPGFIAGNLQSWRKYIEHVGLSGHTARSATRSIVADTWPGRFMSLTLLHEPLHGIHHIRSGLPHYELPNHTDWLEPSDSGDTTPFPNYRTAFKDLLRHLPDPRVGKQWEAVDTPSLPREAAERSLPLR